MLVTLGLVVTGLGGCELLVDFDRDRIPSDNDVDDGGPFEGDDPDGGLGGNKAPNAEDDTFQAQTGRVLYVSKNAGLLNNDTDPEGDALTVKLVDADSAPEALALMPDGSLNFLSETALGAGETMEVTFEYVATDGELDSNPATVTFQVTGTDEPSPKASDDEYEVLEDEVLTVGADEGLGQNDVPVSEGDALEYEVFVEPDSGTLELSQDGSFVYTPDGDSQALGGADMRTVEFSYLATDEDGRSARGLVTITVRGSNDLPSAETVTVTTVPHAAIFAEPGTLLDTLSDADGDELSITAVEEQPTAVGGRVTIAADGSYRYVPPLNVSDTTDSFTFEVDDGTGKVDITVKVDLIGPLVWFVDNSYEGTSDGRSTAPFKTLAEAEATSEPGHTIYIHASDTAYGSLALKDSQTLLGSGQAFAVPGAGNSMVEVVAESEPTVLTGPVNLATNCEVAGVSIEGSGGHGIRGASIERSYLHDLQISSTGSHGILLLGASGLIQIEGVTISQSSGAGLAVSGSGATLDVRDLDIKDVLPRDDAPNAGQGVSADTASVLLQDNTGDFTWTGGSITWSSDNRQPAIKAERVGNLVIAGRSADAPFEVRGAGRGVTSGTAPPGIYVSNATSFTGTHLKVHELTHDNAVADLGAVHLTQVSDTITIEDSLFGAVDGGRAIVGDALVIHQTANTTDFALELSGNRFEGSDLSTAMSITFSVSQAAKLTGQITATEVVGAGQALAINIGNAAGSSARNDIQIEGLSASEISGNGVTIAHRDGAASRIAMSESSISGTSSAVTGIVIEHSATALDLSVEDSEVLTFLQQGITVATSTAGCRVLLSGNLLTDARSSIQTDGAAVLLRTGQGEILDSTIIDNRIRWPQHSLLVRTDDTGEVCLDAHRNSGEDDGEPPSGDFFFGDASGAASLTMRLTQENETALKADNNEVEVTDEPAGTTMTYGSAACVSVQ